jgi:hypothetical protein
MKSAGRGTEMRLRRYLIRGLLGSAVATTAATCAVDVHSSPPPAPLPPASPDGARPVSTTLHVPSRTNLDRVVTIRGQRQTLRAHLAQIDASEPRRLKNGKTVTLQQVVD